MAKNEITETNNTAGLSPETVALLTYMQKQHDETMARMAKQNKEDMAALLNTINAPKPHEVEAAELQKTMLDMERRETILAAKRKKESDANFQLYRCDHMQGMGDEQIWAPRATTQMTLLPGRIQNFYCKRCSANYFNIVPEHAAQINKMPKPPKEAWSNSGDRAEAATVQDTIEAAERMIPEWLERAQLRKLGYRTFKQVYKGEPSPETIAAVYPKGIPATV